MGSMFPQRVGRSRIVMALVALGLIVSSLFAVTAQAAPPMPDATINLAGAGGAEARAAAPVVPYGAAAAFEHTLDGKVAKNYYLTVNVVCRQGDTIVYNWFGQPDFAFPMEAQGGNVYLWDGGDADCSAALRYFANNRLTIVATTAFAVAGD